MTEPFHLKECGFRFNPRHENIYKLILKMLRENLVMPLKKSPENGISGRNSMQL